MASDINRVIMIGRMVKAPDLRYTQAGASVANFTLANNRSYTVEGERRDSASFFQCVAWGKLGEAIAKHCKKGMRIGIEGRLQQRSWEGKDGSTQYAVEIVVETLNFLDSRRPGESAQAVNEVIDESVPSFDEAQQY